MVKNIVRDPLFQQQKSEPGAKAEPIEISLDGTEEEREREL